MTAEPTHMDIEVARVCGQNVMILGDKSLEPNARLIAKHLQSAIEHDRRQSRAIAEGWREQAAALQHENATLKSQVESLRAEIREASA